MRLLAAFALAGCTPDTLALPGEGGDAPPRVVAISVQADAVSPTEPIDITFSERIDARSLVGDAVVIVEGEIDAAFASDLDTPPLAASREARLLPVAVDAQGETVTVQPSAPLRPETVHTLAVSRAIRDEGGHGMEDGYAFRFETALGEDGAPVLEMVTPQSGSQSVPTNLARLLVRFGEPVLGVDATSLSLVHGASNVDVAVAAAEDRCSGCYSMEPLDPLLPGVLHHVHAGEGIRDLDENPPFVGADAPSFTTGAGPDTTPPVLWLPDVRVSGDCLLARWLSNEPATSEVLGALDFRLVEVHEAAAVLLAPGNISFHVESADAADNRSSLGPLDATYAPGPRLVITEVMANPVGAEPAQEWVELANLGGSDVSLLGLQLADEGGSDELPEVTLPSGSVALLVGDAYDPLEGSDPPPGPAAILVRVAGSLAQSGLRNSGERVEIRDDADAVLSSYGGHVDTATHPGQSAVRSDLLGCDLAEAWRRSEPAGSTPGAL